MASSIAYERIELQHLFNQYRQAANLFPEVHHIRTRSTIPSCWPRMGWRERRGLTIEASGQEDDTRVALSTGPPNSIRHGSSASMSASVVAAGSFAKTALRYRHGSIPFALAVSTRL